MKQLHCSKCGHKWLPRTSNPLACPNCKARKWKSEKDERRKQNE